MIYDKVKEVCKEEGISVTALEKQAGLKPGAICKWNNSVPIATNLKAVAEILNKPIEYFLDDLEVK